MLDEFLDGAYCQRVLQKPTAGRRLSEFKAALASDAELRNAAETRRISLTDAICKRCFVSKTHRDVLAEILS